jgi:hypothetical protein
MKLLTITVSLTAALAQSVPALASDALDGTYLLDLDASDSADEMMKELGMNRLMRAAAKKIRTRMVFDGSPDRVTLALSSTLGDRTQEIPMDGSTLTMEDAQFGSGSATARWSEDGSAMIMVSDTQLKDGRTIHNVTTRRLEDPDTLLQLFEVSIDGDETLVIRRIFRRE